MKKNEHKIFSNFNFLSFKSIKIALQLRLHYLIVVK